MLSERRLVQMGLGVGLAIVILAALLWGVFQPWAANHFGYALPGQDRLPYRITYAGRDYGNPNECAGDDWCQPAAKRCISQQQLADQHLWPLKQVGSIPTLFGSAYPILAPPAGGQTILFVLDNDDCYLMYTLMGGP
jgi:hypothetical protein